MEYIEREKYRGWDPYDLLMSPVFRLPVLNNNASIRFLAQQSGKRFPLNIRPVLAVPKGLNPVSLGLLIQGYSKLVIVYPDRKEEFIRKILFLTEELKKLSAPGFNGYCWGYDFHWQARHAKIPAFQPTVVATGIITNALFQCYRIAGIEIHRQMCLEAAGFVLKDLHRSYEGDSFCFSYSPFDHQQVFNASMKGSRILAQAYALERNAVYMEEAGRAAAFTIKHQKPDGSWNYSLAQGGDWVDNYHTGYILDCLDEYMLRTGDDSFKGPLLKGFAFYREYFFENDQIPKFYPDHKYPVDCTAAGQSILTLCRFGDIETAQKVASWMINNMQAIDGHFYFRKSGNSVRKVSFMRWSNAWMFAGLSYLSCILHN